MPAPQGGTLLDDTTRKWRDLADRRLAYFTELYRSGRWKHYYTPEGFAERMRDVIKAAKAWGELANGTFAHRDPARPADEASSPAAQPTSTRNDGMRPAA